MSELRVEVDAVPDPGLLRPAIEAALTGRPWPPGPEAAVAEAIRAEAVAAREPHAARDDAVGGAS